MDAPRVHIAFVEVPPHLPVWQIPVLFQKTDGVIALRSPVTTANERDSTG